ncbi:efflux RND transporter periplasmic adaptor subunit [Sabulicella rubraurantiaca]|uniref:efflux RND transporter periplasmic adaptor subunit n=1 Tax=Sabulicella rubraurantiaca TaxID=2811429 RepID=UPI001A979BD8|nr:efflux RND transporter periplasmic adaptor subunit [Sabulicella rubraurantiaca]
MRRPLALLLILPLLGGGAYLWGAPALGALGLGASAEAGPRLRLAEADRGTITAVVSATGTVNPVNSVIVGSQLSGQIRELMADWNTRVTAGQPLARLDTQQLEASRAAAQADLLAARAAVAVARAQAERAAADAGQARAAVSAARAEVQRAEAQLRDAEFERNRTEELRRSGVGAVRDAARAGFTAEGARATLANQRAQAEQAEANQLSAEAAARTAAAQVETAEAQAEQRAAVLRQVEVNLSFSMIRSPIDGIVVSRSVDLGQTVAASLQAPTLFTIAANLDEMEVWATVDEADIGRIRPGQNVTFTVAAHPQLNLRGRVKDIRLTPATVNNVVTYTVIIAAPNNDGRMLPGMTATLRIVADERRDVLRVPNAALRWRPAGQSAATASAAPESPMAAALRQMDDLTPTQRQEVEAALAEMRERMAAMPGDPEARRQGMQAARQRLQSRLNAVLTPEQRARLAAARGGSGGRGGAAGTVWVAERDGSAPRAVPVRTGLTDGSVTEILSGEIAEGAQVVIGTERASGSAGRPAPVRNLF